MKLDSNKSLEGNYKEWLQGINDDAEPPTIIDFSGIKDKRYWWQKPHKGILKKETWKWSITLAFKFTGTFISGWLNIHQSILPDLRPSDLC